MRSPPGVGEENLAAVCMDWNAPEPTVQTGLSKAYTDGREHGKDLANG